MEEKIKYIEKYVGKETCDRIVEVLGIIGKKFPDNMSVYTATGRQDILTYKVDFPFLERVKGPSCFIVLLGDPGDRLKYPNLIYDLDDIGTITISKDSVALSISVGEYIYKWKRNNDGNHEQLYIYGHQGKKLGAEFNVKNEGITSSELIVEGMYRFPVISSTVTEVGYSQKEYPYGISGSIDRYKDVFTNLLTDNRLQGKIQGEMNKPEVKDTLVKVLSGPIDTLVSNLLTTDQTWRFERERNYIITSHDTAVEKAESVCKELTTRAEKNRDDRISIEDTNRDKLLANVAKQEIAYRDLSKKNAAMLLVQEIHGSGE